VVRGEKLKKKGGANGVTGGGFTMVDAKALQKGFGERK